MSHFGVVAVVVFGGLTVALAGALMVHMHRTMFPAGAVVVTHVCGVVMQVHMGPHSRRQEMVDHVVQAAMNLFEKDPFDEAVDRRFEELGFSVTVRRRTPDARRRFARQRSKAGRQAGSGVGQGRRVTGRTQRAERGPRVTGVEREHLLEVREQLRVDVEMLASRPRHRRFDAEHVMASRDYVQSELEAAGWPVRRQGLDLRWQVGLPDTAGPRPLLPIRVHRRLVGENLVATPADATGPFGAGCAPGFGEGLPGRR